MIAGEDNDQDLRVIEIFQGVPAAINALQTKIRRFGAELESLDRRGGHASKRPAIRALLLKSDADIPISFQRPGGRTQSGRLPDERLATRARKFYGAARTRCGLAAARFSGLRVQRRLRGRSVPQSEGSASAVHAGQKALKEYAGEGHETNPAKDDSLRVGCAHGTQARTGSLFDCDSL